MCALVLFWLLRVFGQCMPCRRQVCCVSGLASCRIRPARKECAETAQWLRGDVAARASPLWAPCRSGRGRVEVQAFALAQDVVQDVHRPWRHGHIELPEGGRGGGRGALRQRGVERARARLHHCPSWLVGYSERQVQRATKATETSGSKLEDRPVVRVPCTSPRGGLFTPVY